ncbi:MAG TPA: thioredoxin family protein, partial [Vicinamibacteria bacterium]|nr:thioredoxin family protein [Vicinamibacteria bacterium]
SSGMPTSPRPQRSFPRLLALAAGAALAARLLMPSVQDRVAWVPAAGAEEAARAAGKPVLYDFTAAWCAPCRRLDRDLFADARRARWLGRSFVPVRVVDREREEGANSEEVERLEARFGVQVFPTLVVAAADGRVLARHEGYGGNVREVQRVLSQGLHAAGPR